MAILPLVIAPDERLNQVSEPVTDITDALRQLLDDMLETMYANQGIGLAAVQVGVHKRVIVIDVAQLEDRNEPMKLINPEIVETSEETESFQEGCLSFPDQFSDVVRPASATIRYMDEHGVQQELKAEGILAVCIQHEIDHINGVVFVDHVSKLKRDMILRRLKKAKRLGAVSEYPRDTKADSAAVEA
jgi:peptide deformylase